MNKDLAARIQSLISKDPMPYKERSGDDGAMERFMQDFPLESLPNLTLEQYCMGAESQSKNFSWWIERGLEAAIGRYSPGTAEGHIIYLKQDHSYYIHRKLQDLGPAKAIEVIRKAIYAVASCGSLEEASILDDRDSLAKKAGISSELLVGGDARLLRILTAYHSDWVVPINSPNHIRHFLTQFSDEPEPVLPKGSIKLVTLLTKVLDEVREKILPEITPWGFSKLLYSTELGIAPVKQGKIPVVGVGDQIDEETEVPAPRNLILYGPPGTGKTYSTIERALGIIDPLFMQKTEGDKDARAKLKARFDELLQAKRVSFVTFHQSFSYEDFVEGLKASTDEKGQIRYEVEDGIFKQICNAATAALGTSGKKQVGPAIELEGRQIWKMSLGNTQGPDSEIYYDCIDNGYALLGWGGKVDFTGSSTRGEITERLKRTDANVVETDYQVTACFAFVHRMKPGDIIVVTDGNYKFRAIGIVKGDYRFLPADEDRDALYQQCRDVDWIRTFSPSLPHDQLMSKIFSQMSIYQLKPPAIDLQSLRNLVNDNPAETDDGPRPYVLIIDEINRGNISRVFGELITLIEDSKRSGHAESLSARLPYSKEMLSVPSNLYIIGTMNTADRSLAQVDIALRRRFVFDELMPDPTILAKLPVIEGIRIDRMLIAMNQRIEVLYDREHTIGHTFFLSLRNDPSFAELERIFSGSILPLLEEYFFEDWEKIRLVLGDHRKSSALAMIRRKYSDSEIDEMFGADPDHAITPAYGRNQAALGSPASYIAIYETASNGADQPS